MKQPPFGLKDHTRVVAEAPFASVAGKTEAPYICFLYGKLLKIYNGVSHIRRYGGGTFDEQFPQTVPYS